MSGSDVDVVVPLRNEERHLPRLLDALSAQTLRPQRVYLVVAPSTDRTQEVAEEAAARDDVFTVLVNEEGTAGSGLNMALALIAAPYWVRIDGHTEVPVDFLERLRGLMDDQAADCVGPVLRSGWTTSRQRAIAEAMSSRIGVGGAAFRTGHGAPKYVDTVAFGMYRTAVTNRVGFFKSELVRNQDDEFNKRFTDAGGRILLTNDTYAIYYPRSDFKGLFSQYRQYGYWRSRSYFLHGGGLAARHVAPGVFAPTLLWSMALTARRRRLHWYTLPLGGYVLILLGFGLSRRLSWREDRDAAIAVATMHSAYGVGLWQGLGFVVGTLVRRPRQP